MDAYVSSRVTVVNPLGLHARAAARFVKLAGRYRSTIQVGRGDRRVDGKSILGLLLLAAPRGSVLEISATGEDAARALAALCLLVGRGFDDDQLSPAGDD
jgi:phosphotransferase system HPr (HPr) family protein